ncbi:MAG: hypothetical protein LBT46_01185 [Planctomycetaceae bacterium]|jgi:hypothetical protein|nr:hypothetical protein [Planctomycetaceae bacterium]
MTNIQERPAGALKFKMPGINEFSVERQESGKYAVSLNAFSGKPFTHWWWGDCIFDRSGASIPFQKIPIDYNHDSTEAVGYLDTFSGETALECNGYLLPFKDGDRASEIIAKKEAGMPYQCSVMLNDNVKEEFVDKGETAEVNGKTVSGPITIFRNFDVIGVAVCLYGSDSNTAVFNNQTQGDQSMSKEPQSVDFKSAQELAKKFAKKFGNDRGFKYFSEGFSETEADNAYIDEVQKGTEFQIKFES